MTRCALCRRRCRLGFDAFERWDGALVCLACIGEARLMADALERGRAATRLMWRYGTGGNA